MWSVFWYLEMYQRITTFYYCNLNYIFDKKGKNWSFSSFSAAASYFAVNIILNLIKLSIWVINLCICFLFGQIHKMWSTVSCVPVSIFTEDLKNWGREGAKTIYTPRIHILQIMYRNGLRICVPIALNVCTEHTGLTCKNLSITYRKLLLAFSVRFISDK